VNVYCNVSITEVYRPFFFAKTTITGHTYLNMLEHFFVPQLDVNTDLATRWGPFHCHTDVTWYLNQIFPGRWIGHGSYILATQIT
jgi:hypothetical protein